VESQKDLENFITLDCIDIARYNQCYLNALSRRSSYYNALNIATCNIFLCEELIEGVQVTVDGFVFKGHVKFFGITKANYHSNSNIFFYHSFPYTFSPELSKKIEQGLSRLIPGLGLENGFFNVELRANEKDNTYKIIEVNSRIAFQFAKTIQAVKGFDPLHLQCDLAVGKYPDLSSTSQRCFRYCYNFELHSFEDARIAQTPTQSAYAELRLKYPEVYIRNLVHEGANLSDFKHNPDSYRYCVLDIPGDSHTEIMDKYEDVVSRLGYKFSPSEPGSDPAMDYPPKTPLSTDQREAVQPCTQPAPSRL
jgi:hypothetical protein